MKFKKKTTANILPAVFWLAVWQAASMALGYKILLPGPASVAVRLFQLAATADFWLGIARSSLRIMGGFGLSCMLAVLAAGLAYALPWLRALLQPLVSAVKAVPVASFIILALVWVRSAYLSVLISAMMCFPTVYLGVLEAAGTADPALLEMSSVYRMGLWHKIAGIYIPAVLPAFRSAVKLALGLCSKSGIAAEVIGLPKGTVGDHLYRAKIYFETPDLFAWTVTIVLVAAVLEKVVLWIADRFMKPFGLEKEDS